jgi:hypothetical protein
VHLSASRPQRRFLAATRFAVAGAAQILPAAQDHAQNKNGAVSRAVCTLEGKGR